jgi:UDP-N-acetylmuramoyl-L-alanyl-D-glutamate--2,6-diaminopimelate ligase
MWQATKNIYHLFVAIAANFLYGFSSRNLTVIGVTGTDGKTTTVSLIHHILNSAGKKTAMISTVGAKIGNNTYDVGFHVTNPASFPLQKLIKKASQSAEYLVLEVTSHGLDQHRVFGVNFTIGVLTNVTHEHLDYHKTYDRYARTKIKLLLRSKTAVVNRDDESFEHVSKVMNHESRKEWITYGIKHTANITPKTLSYKTSLVGEFNTYNILAAIAVCKKLGLSDEEIKKGIASFQAPVGRQEIVYNKDFTVMIDFAHTPAAFNELLLALSKQSTGRIIHMFGAAGKRDASKRPTMGEISARYADVIILTAEDPRGEPLEKISQEIEKGIIEAGKKRNVLKINDRTKAIQTAINMARKGDIVLLTGKGHEKSINYGNGEEPWNEFEEAKKALKQKK